MPALLKSQFKSILPDTDESWFSPLVSAMTEWSIDSPQRVAAFIAQVAHESKDFTRLEENLNYSAKRLCAVWPARFPTLRAAQPYVMNSEKLANRVYSGRLGNGNASSGDGWRYRGRGLIQITGKSNYAACKKALDIDVTGSPELLLECEAATRSAAWFWSSRGLNELADHSPGDDDESDFVRITTIINGGKAGLAERLEYWASARETLGA